MNINRLYLFVLEIFFFLNINFFSREKKKNDILRNKNKKKNFFFLKMHQRINPSIIYGQPIEII